MKKIALIIMLILCGTAIGRQITLKTLEIADIQEDKIFISSFDHIHIYEI